MTGYYPARNESLIVEILCERHVVTSSVQRGRWMYCTVLRLWDAQQTERKENFLLPNHRTCVEDDSQHTYSWHVNKHDPQHFHIIFHTAARFMFDVLKPLKCNNWLALGAIAKQSREAIISLIMSVRLSICPYGTVRLPTDGVFVKFHIWGSY